MKSILTVILISAAILFASCGSDASSSNSERPKTPEELRVELKQKEEIAPLEYLKDKGVTMLPQQKKIRNGGLFRDAEYAPDGAIFEGDFINSATLAKFKDIQVNVSYFSKTKTLIKEESYIIYEFFPPNTTKHFSFKVAEIPEAQKSFAFEIVGATAIN